MFAQVQYNIHAMVEAGKIDPENTFLNGLEPAMFIRFLDTPERIVLEFTPEISISFDGDKMAHGTAQAYSEFAAQDKELQS
ncbi:MAG: hypothetical protein ACJAYC_001795 [Halieaceae bacterium]|jgi:hypothetical protein